MLRSFCALTASLTFSSLHRLLKPYCHQFLGANCVEEGIALLGSEKIDLIIFDMRMLGTQGAAILGIARERWPSIIHGMLIGYSDVMSGVLARRQYSEKNCQGQSDVFLCLRVIFST